MKIRKKGEAEGTPFHGQTQYTYAPTTDPGGYNPTYGDEGQDFYEEGDQPPAPQMQQDQTPSPQEAIQYLQQQLQQAEADLDDANTARNPEAWQEAYQRYNQIEDQLTGASDGINKGSSKTAAPLPPKPPKGNPAEAPPGWGYNPSSINPYDDPEAYGLSEPQQFAPGEAPPRTQPARWELPQEQQQELPGTSMTPEEYQQLIEQHPADSRGNRYDPMGNYVPSLEERQRGSYNPLLEQSYYYDPSQGNDVYNTDPYAGVTQPSDTSSQVMNQSNDMQYINEVQQQIGDIQNQLNDIQQNINSMSGGASSQQSQPGGWGQRFMNWIGGSKLGQGGGTGDGMDDSDFMNQQPPDPNDQGYQNLYMAAANEFAQDPDVNQASLEHAVMKAYETPVPGDQGDDDMSGKMNNVRFFLGKQDQVMGMKYAAACSGPLVCPACHGKVARIRENPNYFRCKAGHTSEVFIRPNDNLMRAIAAMKCPKCGADTKSIDNGYFECDNGHKSKLDFNKQKDSDEEEKGKDKTEKDSGFSPWALKMAARSISEERGTDPLDEHSVLLMGNPRSSEGKSVEGRDISIPKPPSTKGEGTSKGLGKGVGIPFGGGYHIWLPLGPMGFGNGDNDEDDDNDLDDMPDVDTSNVSTSAFYLN